MHRFLQDGYIEIRNFLFEKHLFFYRIGREYKDLRKINPKSKASFLKLNALCPKTTFYVPICKYMFCF